MTHFTLIAGSWIFHEFHLRKWSCCIQKVLWLIKMVSPSFWSLQAFLNFIWLFLFFLINLITQSFNWIISRDGGGYQSHKQCLDWQIFRYFHGVNYDFVQSVSLEECSIQEVWTKRSWEAIRSYYRDLYVSSDDIKNALHWQHVGLYDESWILLHWEILWINGCFIRCTGPSIWYLYWQGLIWQSWERFVHPWNF